MAPIRAFTDPALDDEWTVRGLVRRGALPGAVSLELFGHPQYRVLDYYVHFAQVVDQLAADLGLT